MIIKSKIYIAGLFFVSSTQEGRCCDRLSQSMSNNLNLIAAPQFEETTNNKGFFSHDLLSKKLPQHPVTNELVSEKNFYQKKPLATAMMVFSVISILVIA